MYQTFSQTFRESTIIWRQE